MRSLYMIEFDLEFAKGRYEQYGDKHWEDKIKKFRQERIEYLDKFQPNWREDAKKMNQEFCARIKKDDTPRMSDWVENFEEYGDNTNFAHEQF